MAIAVKNKLVHANIKCFGNPEENFICIENLFINSIRMCNCAVRPEQPRPAPSREGAYGEQVECNLKITVLPDEWPRSGVSKSWWHNQHPSIRRFATRSCWAVQRERIWSEQVCTHYRLLTPRARKFSYAKATPYFKLTWGAQPSALILAMSITLRIVPSGLDVSCTNLPA
ncbi:MAG: hypothetical protein JWQ21_3012 [Herminiimonas sp.]|nr:hypothetical protein [Herminiimonas sp.]